MYHHAHNFGGVLRNGSLDDPAELDNMQARLIDTEATMKDTKAALKRVEDNYNTLKRSLDNTMNEIRPIKAKVIAAKL
jgi:hypothetical protein